MVYVELMDSIYFILNGVYFKIGEKMRFIYNFTCMKKTAILALGYFFLASMVKAQDCTPTINTSLTTPGLTPSQLPLAEAGVPYDEVIDWVIPYRIDNFLTPAPGDSIWQCALEVMQLPSLPAGFTAEVWAYHSPGNSYEVLSQTVDTIHIYQITGALSRACIRIKNPNPTGPVNLADCLSSIDSLSKKLYTGIWTDVGFGCQLVFQDSIELGIVIIDSAAAWTACDTQMVANPGSLCNTQSLTVCPGGSVMVGIHVYSATGTYYDVLISSNGCDSIVTTHLEVIDCSGFTQEVWGAVQIYPNPANDLLTINSPETAITGIRIYAISGQLIYQYTGEWNGIKTIPVNELRHGLYTLFLTDASGHQYARKLMVVH